MGLVAIYVVLDLDQYPRYVGKTINPKQRRIDHKWQHHWFGGFIVLEWCEPEVFKPREGYWIKYFRTMGFSLENKNDGGGGLRSHTPEQIERLRTIGKRRVFSLATKKKQSLAAQERYKSREQRDEQRKNQTGKTYSQESKQKMRLAKLGKQGAKKGKKYPKSKG